MEYGVLPSNLEKTIRDMSNFGESRLLLVLRGFILSNIYGALLSFSLRFGQLNKASS